MWNCQTTEAVTDRPGLPPQRQISTLPNYEIQWLFNWNRLNSLDAALLATAHNGQLLKSAYRIQATVGKVFSRALHVLKAGGRLAISDIVATGELPNRVKQDMELFTRSMAIAGTPAAG